MMVLSATDPYLQRALALHVAGDFAQAAAAYAEVPKDHPHAARVHYLHAGAALRAKGIAVARRLLSRAAALEGRLLDENAGPGDYATLGDCLRTTWRLDEALPCYEMALQLDDGVIGAYLGLGLIHAACNRPFEAAMYFQNALRLDAGCVPALINLGAMWRRVGR